ncbi:MAG TPA: hypothetical protein VFH06_00950 [Candidatus Saccharimonadales bacterium]|nr:hypothetical protein [Candidatus Saccharimonadales bacterium]
MAEKHSYTLGEGVDYTFSARLEIPEGQELNRGKVLDRLVRHALKTADPHLPIIGGVVGEGRFGPRKEVVFGLDPSKSWGTPEADDYGELVDRIGRTELWVPRSEDVPAARVPLGRRREYDESNEEFTMEEVEALFRQSGRQALRLTAADLFSIRYLPNSKHPVMYHEPGTFVDISAAELNDGALEDVLAIAEQMDQDRLAPSITNVRTQVYNRGVNNE